MFETRDGGVLDSDVSIAPVVFSRVLRKKR